MREGSYSPLRRRRMVVAGWALTEALRCALMSCLTAAKLNGRCCGTPVDVASFAAKSTSSFSWMPVCDGHQTRVTVATGEVLSSLRIDATTTCLSERPGEARSGCVRARMEG